MFRQITAAGIIDKKYNILNNMKRIVDYVCFCHIAILS
jgi:hypothetical protein